MDGSRNMENGFRNKKTWLIPPWLRPPLWLQASDHRRVTVFIFFCTFVAFWERIGFAISFTHIANDMGLTETEKGAVFSSYYYGFAVTQIPGGYLSNRYGGKLILAISFLLFGPASALTALPSARPDCIVPGIVACRLAVGAAQGVFLPAAHSVLAHWIPPENRGPHFAVAMSGMYAGAATAMITVPLLVSHGSATTTFYIAAGLALTWVTLWIIAGSDKPREAAKIVPINDFSGSAVLVNTTTSGRMSTVEDDGLSPSKRASNSGGHSRLRFGGSTSIGMKPSPAAALESQTTSRKYQQHPSRRCARQSANGGGGDGGSVSNWSFPTTVVALPAHPEEEESDFGAHGGYSSPRSRARLDVSGNGGSSDHDGGNSCDDKLPRSGSYGGRRTAPTTPPGAAAAEGKEEVVEDQRQLANRSGSKDTANPRHFRNPGAFTSPIPISPWSATGPQQPSTDSGIGEDGGLTPREAVMSQPKTTGDERQRRFRRTLISSASFMSGAARTGNNRPKFTNMWATGSSGGGSSRNGNRPRSITVSPSSTSDGEGTARGGEPEAESSEALHRCAPKSGTKRVKDQTINRVTVDGRNSSPFPWKEILASPAAWAVVAGNVGAGTAVNVVMSWLPTYFEELIQVDLSEIGLFAQLSPYLAMMAFSILGGVCYCWLITSRDFSVASSSKIVTGVAFSLALCMFLCMGLARSPTTAAVWSSLALASAALSRGGWSTNHVEIAEPEHAAMLYSVANSVSAAASVVGLAVTGKLLDVFGGGEAPFAWTAAMGSIGVLCATCGIFFVNFAGGNEVLFPRAASTAAASDEDDGSGVGGEPEDDVAARASPCYPRPFGFGRDVFSSAPGPRPSILRSTDSRSNVFASAPVPLLAVVASSSSMLVEQARISSVATTSSFRMNDPAAESQRRKSSLLSASSRQFEYYGAGGAM